MPTLIPAKRDVLDLLAQTIHHYHSDLESAEVTVGVLVAWPKRAGDEFPVKLHGYPCQAVVKITPYRARVQGVQDAVITIDGPNWERLDEGERIALLDHELTHLELVRDDEGNVKGDDHGRPKLTCRLHDWELGGFAAVAKRHGNAAPEVKSWREAHTAYHQAVFAWGDDNAPQDSVPTLEITRRGDA